MRWLVIRMVFEGRHQKCVFEVEYPGGNCAGSKTAAKRRNV